MLNLPTAHSCLLQGRSASSAFISCCEQWQIKSNNTKLRAEDKLTRHVPYYSETSPTDVFNGGAIFWLSYGVFEVSSSLICIVLWLHFSKLRFISKKNQAFLTETSCSFKHENSVNKITTEIMDLMGIIIFLLLLTINFVINFWNIYGKYLLNIAMTLWLNYIHE